MYCRQGSLEPEAIRVCGHGDTEALEVKAGLRGLGVPRGPLLAAGEPGGAHLEAPGRVQSGNILNAPQGPPGHKHSMAPAVRGLPELPFCGLVSQG